RKSIIEKGSIYGNNLSRPVSEVPISEEAPESSSPPCFSPCEAPIGPPFTYESDRLEYSGANRLITD
ncbi:14266_t:CDS:1, partial [Funneliformis geosporum]